MDNLNFIDEELIRLEEKNLKREIKEISSGSGPWVELSSGHKVLQFASNNYLGLANNPEILNAANSATIKYGIGSTGSRLLSGTSSLHIQLEKAIADFQKSEASLFFSSGFMANMGVISSLVSDNDIVFSDENNHASIIDSIKLTKAKTIVFKHNDLNHLESLINENLDSGKRMFLIIETMYGVDCDGPNLNELANIIKKYNLIPIVDEAHSVGVFGKKGEGLILKEGLQDVFNIRIGTCSKAIGVEGAFCVAPKKVIEYLKNKARTFMFSTAPPISTTSAVLKSIELIQDGDWRREKLWDNAKDLYAGLRKNYKLNIRELNAPFIIIDFYDLDNAVEISNMLFNECHVWASLFRPPSSKTPKLKLAPIATHNNDDINYVIKAFNYLADHIKVQPLSSTV